MKDYKLEEEIFKLIADRGLGLIEAWILLNDMTEQINKNIHGVLE